MSHDESPAPERDSGSASRRPPGEEVFTDADLEPSPEERRLQWRRRVDWVATGIALAVSGVWAGGIVAVRWGVEPTLSERLPASLVDVVRAATLQRADQLALSFAAVVLGAEVARTAAATLRRRSALARVRRIVAVVAGAFAALCSLIVTPQAISLIAGGILDAPDPVRSELGALWQRGDQLRFGQLALLAVLLLLHLLTLPRAADEESESDAVAPGAPGPWQPAGR